MSYNEGVKLIRGLQGRWKKGQPKNFSNNHYVNNIHSIITSSKLAAVEYKELLELLYNSNYFDNVLWACYHEDATNNHIELMLLIAIYEIEVIKRGTIVDQMMDQMDSLLTRLLLLTVEYKSETSRLGVSILRFFNKLITFKLNDRKVKKLVRPLFNVSTWCNLPNVEEIRVRDAENNIVELKDYEDIMKEYQLSLEDNLLTANKLKRRWLHSSLTNLMKQVCDTSEFIDYLKHYLALLISLVSQMPLREYPRVLINEVGFVAALKSLNLAEVRILKLYMDFPINGFTGELYNIATSSNFNRLQSIIFNETNQIDQFLSLSSVFECSPRDLSAYLQRFDITALEKILGKMNISGNYPPELKSPSFLIDILIEHIYLETTDNFIYPSDHIDEAILSNKDLFRLPIENTQYLTVHDYDFRLAYNQSVRLTQDISKHLASIAPGLKITDPERPGGIKSSSKYFDSISEIKLNEEQRYEIASIDPKKLNNNKLIVLLAIQKPNKTSPNLAIAKYGISKLALGQVVQENQLISVNFNSDIDYKRFNHLIYLPEELCKQTEIFSILKAQSTTLPDYIEDLFLGFERKTSVARYDVQKNRPTEFVIDCINLNELENVKTAKRLKTAEGKVSPEKTGENALIVKFEPEDTVIEDYPYLPKAKTLNKKETHILISAISTGLTLVEYEQPKHIKRVLASICRTLVQNFPQERAVIVTSREIDIGDKWFLFNDDQWINQYIARIDKFYDKQLRQISSLTRQFGLDQFPFDENGENLVIFFKLHIKPRWEKFLQGLGSAESIQQLFESVFFSPEWDWSGDYTRDLEVVVKWFYGVNVVVDELNRLIPIIRFKTNKEQLQQLVVRKYAKVIVVREEDFVQFTEQYQLVDSLIMVDTTTVNIRPSKRMVLFNSRNNRLPNLYSRFEWLSVETMAI